MIIFGHGKYPIVAVNANREGRLPGSRVVADNADWSQRGSHATVSATPCLFWLGSGKDTPTGEACRLGCALAHIEGRIARIRLGYTGLSPARVTVTDRLALTGSAGQKEG